MEQTKIGKPFKAQGKTVYLARVTLESDSEGYVFHFDDKEQTSVHKNIEWGVTEDKTIRDILDMVKGNDNIEELVIRII